MSPDSAVDLRLWGGPVRVSRSPHCRDSRIDASGGRRPLFVSLRQVPFQLRRNRKTLTQRP